MNDYLVALVIAALPVDGKFFMLPALPNHSAAVGLTGITIAVFPHETSELIVIVNGPRVAQWIS